MSFEEERRKIEEELWSLIHVEGVVVDCGIGRSAVSTRALLKKGVSVVALDRDGESLRAQKGVGAILVQGDIGALPFKERAAHTVVFFFTLHEIDPSLHPRIIGEAGRVGSHIVIVEPHPSSQLYGRFEGVWREAMHEVGKFEDYNPPSYWENLLQASGFTIIGMKTFERKEVVPPDVVEEIRQESVEELRKEGVSEKYVHEIERIAEEAKREGMQMPDITLVIGSSKNPGNAEGHTSRNEPETL